MKRAFLTLSLFAITQMYAQENKIISIHNLLKQYLAKEDQSKISLAKDTTLYFYDYHGFTQTEIKVKNGEIVFFENTDSNTGYVTTCKYKNGKQLFYKCKFVRNKCTNAHLFRRNATKQRPQ